MTVLQKIKIWMITAGINASFIADEYGCSEAFVSLFFSRKRMSKKLVDYLIDKGCPEEYFENGKIAADRAKAA